MKTEKLILKYRAICDEFIRKFEKKHGYEFDYWVADKPGEVASFVEQYFFNLSDIIYDLATDQPKGLIFRWQDECVESGVMKINYYAYSKGIRLQPEKEKEN